MASCWTISLVVTFLFCSFCYGYVDLPAPLPGTETYQLRMPGANPAVDDAYLCTAYKLDPEKEMYITGFRVEGTAERAHHMILSGCGGIPEAADKPYWYKLCKALVYTWQYY